MTREFIVAPDGYIYEHTTASESHQYLRPTLLKVFEDLSLDSGRLFEIGSGNGSTAGWLHAMGFNVSGIDPSPSGIHLAHANFPGLDLHVGEAIRGLDSEFGTFPVVLSLEVIEHVYRPRDFVACAWDLLEPGGALVMSTPYHGYLKNLALAASGRMDKHFTALWDCGHIKFWSERTLRTLLVEAGFTEPKFYRSGRVPPFAKSMFAVAARPSGS